MKSPAPMKHMLLAFCASLLFSADTNADAPSTFSAAKVAAKQNVFFDQASSVLGELYCGCKWEWTGKSGGRVDSDSCGYQTRAQQNRADRIEWEHILPAWVFGHQRQCWQSGGRKNCVADDPIFRAMEADLYNLYPAVGEVNGDRSHYQYGMVNGVASQYGACGTKVDFVGRSAEPRDEVKGLVARSTFYMYDRYGLSMSRQQQQLLMAWNQQHPVSQWEKEWNNRTARIMGHFNPFVTGNRSWSLGHEPSREGLVNPNSAPIVATGLDFNDPKHGSVLANRNSKIYHLRHGCPSYSNVSSKNRVVFKSEAEAMAAGYRKAGNCH